MDIIEYALPIAEVHYGKTNGTIGSGYNGVAFSMENGSVLKLTTSALEAITVNFIRELQAINPVTYIDGIVEYYTKAHIVAGDGKDGNSVFAYSMERVKGVTKEQANAIPKYNLATEAEDTPPSNAFFHAYRAVHAMNSETDKKKREKLKRVYLENLMKCASVPGYENASQAIISLATSSDNGGPFLVGDFKPVNCGLPLNGTTEVKAFDLYIYNVPNAKRFVPEKL